MAKSFLSVFRWFLSDNPKSKIEKQPRRPKWLSLSAIAFSLVLTGAVALAQQPTQVPRIGTLSVNSLANTEDRINAFRQGLREHGYEEGRNITIDQRAVDGKLDLLPKLAAELVGLKPNVLVSLGPAPTRALKAATTTFPIVITNDPDPVADRIVASLARPGGITSPTGNPELSPDKEKQFRRELVLRALKTLQQEV